jgi:hypothetical protein
MMASGTNRLKIARAAAHSPTCCAKGFFDMTTPPEDDTTRQLLTKLASEQALERKYIEWAGLAAFKLDIAHGVQSKYACYRTVYSVESLLQESTAEYVAARYLAKFGSKFPAQSDWDAIRDDYVTVYEHPVWARRYFAGGDNALDLILQHPLLPAIFIYLADLSDEESAWAMRVLADALTAQLRYYDPHAGFWSLLSGDKESVKLAFDLAMKRALQHSRKKNEVLKALGVVKDAG